MMFFCEVFKHCGGRTGNDVRRRAYQEYGGGMIRFLLIIEKEQADDGDI
jgi:hypothetical protein